MTHHMQTQRFMLLATARTGSNLLSSLLSANPAVKMYGELFNLDALPRKSQLEALQDPLLYLQDRVYKEHRPEIAAVGFKMFYEHLKKDYFQKAVDVSEASERLRSKMMGFASYIEANYDWSTLAGRFRDTWNALIEDRTLAVIHLRRRNLLHTLVSHKTAFVTGQFWSLSDEGQERTTLHLHPEECRRYFQRLETLSAEADVAFANHPTLDVTYEDLVEARDEELKKICRFLKVPSTPVSTLMTKQIRSPVSEIVDNYSELRACFEHTKWNTFFE